MIPVPLRVGVATGRQVVSWQARCIESITAVRGVELVRWVAIPEELPPRRRGADAGALDPVDAPEALASLAPTAHPAPSHGPATASPIDVLVDLTRHGLGSPVPWAAAVWRFGYGPRLVRDPDLAALIGYVRGSGATRVAMLDEATGMVVRDGWLETVSWWTGAPLERMLIDPLDWPALELHSRRHPAVVNAVREHVGGIVGAPAESPSADRTRGLGWSADPPSALLRFGARGRRVRGWWDVMLRHPEWNIGVVETPIEGMLVDPDRPIRWLPTRPGRFAADPFGIERDGVLHILFEEFDQRAGRGFISHTSIDRDGVISDPERALDTGLHASYPFLIQHEGAVFMLPEIAAAGELVLYEAVDFPARWRPAATLLRGIPAVDATVIEHEGIWWLFATRLDRGANQNLFIWHAPGLLGPWTAHDANPVKTDARSARPAGTPFHFDGRLYRPSQDNSQTYGGRVVLNRIDRLTPIDFIEEPVGFVGPKRGTLYPDGLHTLSAVGDRTLVDGKVLHLVPEVLQANVASKLTARPSR